MDYAIITAPETKPIHSQSHWEGTSQTIVSLEISAIDYTTVSVSGCVSELVSSEAELQSNVKN
jgi:hypothetical protein